LENPSQTGKIRSENLNRTDITFWKIRHRRAKSSQKIRAKKGKKGGKKEKEKRKINGHRSRHPLTTKKNQMSENTTAVITIPAIEV
jgi:hypothetical protein